MGDIKDYFLIGDLHSAALVSRGGSIGWLCVPHFDSPSVFAKILDENAGEFSVESGKKYHAETNYMKNTPIVKTTFRNNKDEFSVKDFMVPQPRNKTDSHILVRKIHAKKGNHEVKLVYKPKINYGKNFPDIKIRKDFLEFLLGKDKVILHLPKDTGLVINKNKFILILNLKEDETKEIFFENCTRKGDYKNRDLEKKTRAFWEKWIKKGTFFEFCRERLIRSAITLKMMQFYSTGALIAAPTTSIPESINGNRNWDYRYVWLRDATFTLYALYALGYTDESKRFFRFIDKISKKFEKGSDLNLVYTINGEKPMKEKSLNYLDGYKNSRPVRIGNDAAEEFQLDTYGVLIDSYYFMIKKGFKISKKKRKIILHLVDMIEKKWKEKDSGIWEYRENIRHYTYSKVASWLGVNRVLRIADELKLSKERRAQLERLEEEIRYWIWNNCYSIKKNKLFRHPESRNQDSTNFLFVLWQFLNKHDPVANKIINNTMKELVRKKIFIYRYKESDEFKGKEGTFVMCSFWMISALAILERVDEAEKLFGEFEKKINGNGLLSEEINPETGEYLGNYPQAFSHMGYIMSAYYLDKYRKKLSEKSKKSKK